jgi:cellulose biosynthesis protein BcsQ
MRPDRFSILGFTNLTETIKIFRKNCPDPHAVKVLGIVFTQVTGTSVVEQEAIDDIRSAAEKEGTYLFKATLKYSKSFNRSVKDQTPIFVTGYAQHLTRRAPGKIADEMKDRITALEGASSTKGKKK